jgi:glycosyltransferase involved in cell wall biosynthesis
MESLLGDASLRNRLATNAFQRVNQHYGWEKIVATFEALYRKVKMAKAPPDDSDSHTSKSSL